MLLRGWTGCLGFLAFAVSNAVGWVYLQNTTAFQGNATFPSYDYEDFVEPFYDLTGLLLPVTITSGCNLTVPLPPLASLNVKHEYNTTMLVLERCNMLLSDCHTYQSIFVQAPQVLHTIKDLGYPPVQVLLLSALLNSDENFGNSKDEYFYDFEATRPPNIHLALVGRDTGQLLWALAQDTGPVPIRVIQDPGFWNRFRRSPLELAHIVFRYILFVPLIMTCAYYVFTIIWSICHLFDTRILVLACAAYFALGSIVAPVGEGKERYADVIRYTSWITLYTCYYWMVFKWLLIIKRVQYPRGIIVFMVFTGLCASIMLLYSLLHVILLFHENIIINVIKRITIVYCFPPIVALQGIAMITYVTVTMWSLGSNSAQIAGQTDG
ncbi:hypothetical protein H4R35_004394 [Dimargaris xerosporica]|nr:hypothetical protein H4R35_004394 [Dimargaris xerosporica]